MPTIIVVIIKLAWHFTLVHNGYVYGVVWRFEERTYQTATKFIWSNTLEISTIRQMHYTRC